jgi:uncharacterized repeat protein (TIGR01451 family)
VTEKKRRTGNGLAVIFLATALLAIAGIAFHFGSSLSAAKASGSHAVGSQVADREALAAKSLSVPLVFEPNQGQTAAPVKFVAHGAGYGLFLTSDEAVLALQGAAIKNQHSAFSSQSSAPSSQRAPGSVIRMRLEGANSSARVSGSAPLPGRTSYIIGNNPAKWHRDVPQFGGVEYASVYRGVDLVYYGNQGQLEYDFRVAPGADPNQIALNFQGASARIIKDDSEGGSGDLVLTTASGEVRFHAPRVYQPATTASGESAGSGETEVQGSFRQLANNKIGFAIGDYDHSRELVIDPTLSYSTFLGGTAGIEGPSGLAIPGQLIPWNVISVAVDPALNIYLAGSTTSTNFTIKTGTDVTAGAQNIFISKIYPLSTGSAQLIYSIILGGTDTTEVDTLAGIVVDQHENIYVAGSTYSATLNSATFPTNGTNAPFQAAPVVAGTHGFLSAFTVSSSGSTPYTLAYSTYLSGNGTDIVTGLAVDLNQNAYVTGNTTSSNPATSVNGFPANPNGYQLVSNSPGNPQFFASKISTTAGSTGALSMLYSTYFGGAFPSAATNVAIIANGGGAAVDLGNNMYITGTTNMVYAVPTESGLAPFPLLNAQQTCLNQPGGTSCTPQNATSVTDGFVAKIDPSLDGSQSLVYSTYIGGSGTDTGLGIAVDTAGNAWVAGSTNSSDWNSTLTQVFQPAYAGSASTSNGYVAELVNSNGLSFPLNYFTYLGGTGPDSALAIQVDSVDGVHVAGYTESPNFPSLNPLPVPGGNCAGASPSVPYAFVTLIETSLPGQAAGDYSTCLGGSGLTQGTGIAIDNLAASYVAGTTQAANYPLMNPYQQQLNGSQNAFVSRLGGQSTLQMTATASPSPVNAGQQATFTFNITNTSGDNATNVTFIATIPSTGLLTTSQALVAGGLGTCNPVQGTTILCVIPTLAAGASAQVEVEVTANATTFPPVIQMTVYGVASANGNSLPVSQSATVQVVDFTVSCSTTTPEISAGDTAAIQVVFQPAPTNDGFPYIATITPSDTISPSMVTSPTPTFNPINVPMTGQTSGSTTLSIGTVARPVNSGSLLRRGSFYASFYATWLPIGGVSLIGLGIGAGRKRRRWLMGAVLGLVAGVILLLPSCGSNSNVATSTGGTLAGTYIITIEGSAGTGSSHSCPVTLTVN